MENFDGILNEKFEWIIGGNFDVKLDWIFLWKLNGYFDEKDRHVGQSNAIQMAMEASQCLFACLWCCGVMEYECVSPCKVLHYRVLSRSILATAERFFVFDLTQTLRAVS